ncbi:hypothetical protein ACPW96_18640 [Micromonospora sp. DT81.3]|uniref:hypothetical protein n=1 Tax=Micromonospora sp. DT81.3 TaxID=3416523 RepID=UPI003CEF3F96
MQIVEGLDETEELNTFGGRERGPIAAVSDRYGEAPSLAVTRGLGCGTSGTGVGRKELVGLEYMRNRGSRGEFFPNTLDRSNDCDVKLVPAFAFARSDGIAEQAPGHRPDYRDIVQPDAPVTAKTSSARSGGGIAASESVIPRLFRTADLSHDGIVNESARPRGTVAVV